MGNRSCRRRRLRNGGLCRSHGSCRVFDSWLGRGRWWRRRDRLRQSGRRGWCRRWRLLRDGHGGRGLGCNRWSGNRYGGRRRLHRGSGWSDRVHGRRRRRHRRGRLHPGRFRCGLLRCFIGGDFLFGGYFRFGDIVEMFPHLYGGVHVNRTRVRLLFGDASFRQIVNDDFRLDLELAGQLVDADLIRLAHLPPRLLLHALFDVSLR
jgi:hypothetical protein